MSVPGCPRHLVVLDAGTEVIQQFIMVFSGSHKGPFPDVGELDEIGIMMFFE